MDGRSDGDREKRETREDEDMKKQAEKPSPPRSLLPEEVATSDLSPKKERDNYDGGRYLQLDTVLRGSGVKLRETERAPPVRTRVVRERVSFKTTNKTAINAIDVGTAPVTNHKAATEKHSRGGSCAAIDRNSKLMS